MQPVRSSDARTPDSNDQAAVVLVADGEPVLTDAAASVIARLVRNYIEDKRAAA